ncbi:MAG TPA: NADH-quinone oxidoreductase subunit NuoH [Pirellulales bacterium]|jgi:NADH-quinone oxidoreductase subunit H|nr:NADH-quinone oxidoreductase subunit NuoH [Pirellulales bacterium]
MSLATIITLVKILLLVGGLLTAAAYLVLLERWMAAWVQDRRGPNRVGIPLTNIKMFGLGQPLADGLKFIFKEEFTPSHVDKSLFRLAPIVIMTAAVAIFAAIPFGSVLPPLGINGIQDPIPLLVAPGLDVGMVYIFALSSIAVYGVILGGWASNNKYSFLGALRSSAQLISYEIPLGLGLLGVVLLCGTLKLDSIIAQQASTGVWNVFLQPLGFFVFVVAATAEAARLPFDLPEAEQELIGGYHTEYSGMKLLLYLIAEFLHMITAAFLIVILFLGGWHFWGLTGSGNEITWPIAILRIVVLAAKILAVILLFMIVRWSWPRFRFDQLMSLAWKVMVPLGLVNLVVTAVLVEYGRPIAQAVGFNSVWVTIILSWGITLVAWVVAGLLAPLSTDNTPRPTALPFDAESELGHEA